MDEKPYLVYSPASLGAAIRHFRRQRGMTQQELAERAGIDRYYLSRLEQGGETEQLRRAFRILRELGLRVRIERA